MRLVILSAVVGLAALQPASAQRPGDPNHLARDPYVTRSGETVDKPGVPQGSSTTPMDRAIQRQDNKIDDSLCRGC